MKKYYETNENRRNQRKWVKLLLCLFCLISSVITPFLTSAAAKQTVDFARDIRPIFEAACYQCHGAKKSHGQLRLDNGNLALKGGISGAAIIPGNAKGSLLIRR